MGGVNLTQQGAFSGVFGLSVGVSSEFSESTIVMAALGGKTELF